MLKDDNKNFNGDITIPKVQRYLFFALVFLLPITIIPFPWDWTERGMSLLILIISTMILGLEVIKLVWEGKSSILKASMDIGVFVIVLSMLLTTIFSNDVNASMWGIDDRLGVGLVMFLVMFATSISARTFLDGLRDVKYVLIFFLTGLFINNLFSIFSFLGVNIWGIIPAYKDLHQSGLPLLRSAKVHLLVNMLSLFISFGFIGEFFIKRARESLLILSIIFGFVSIFNIWIYSIHQGLYFVVCGGVLLSLFTFLILKKINLQSNVFKSIFTFLLLGIALLLVPVILLQIPSVRDAVIPKSIDLVAQLSLGTDVSWSIAASALAQSFIKGLFGFGVDTYSSAFYLYKPLSTSLVAYNDVNFYYASNEIFTQFTNGGLVWILSWFFFGFLIFKNFVKDIRQIKIYANNEYTWYILIIDLCLLTVFLGSMFLSFSVLIIFLLLTLVAAHAVLKSKLMRELEDRFVLKLWAVNVNARDTSNKALYSANIFITAVISLVMLFVCGVWISKTVASFYSLRAEAYFVEESKKYQGDIFPTIEDRGNFIDRMNSLYEKALKFDKNNPLINRRYGLMNLERIGIAAEKYTNEKDEGVKAQLLKDVAYWKNYALDSTRKSIDISPSVYANWEARSKIYMGLVGMGFYDYAQDSVYALEKSIELNPLNFELYYSLAQVYMAKGEKDNALSALIKVLKINPQHIPSILLSGNINKEKGNIDVYESYLKAAKKILEAQGKTDLEIYGQIAKELSAIPPKEEAPGSTEEPQEDVEVQESESSGE